MTKERDWFAEFRGKQKLSEADLLLMKRRLNKDQIDLSRFREGGYALTNDQVMKGRKWLMNQWVTESGVERKNNPFGYREQEDLKRFKTIRLIDFYNTSRFRSKPYYEPVYRVLTTASRGFDYYVFGGKINIIG